MEPTPAQRGRKRPVSKWKDSEITLLIDYLNRNREFEKPSQRIYYQNFIRQYGVDIPWDLIKCKVHNLHTKYVTLRDLFKLGDQENTNFITLKKFCPYFDQLEHLFEGKRTAFGKGEIESATDVSVSMNSSNTTNLFKMEEVSLDQHPKLPDNKTGPRTIPISETILLRHNPFIIKDEKEWETDVSTIQQNNIEDSAVNTSLNSPVDLLPTSSHQLTSEINKSHCSNETPEMKPPETDLEMLKFNFEKEKFFRRMALKEKIVDFQMESARKKYELKTVSLELEKIKIEKDLHLAKLRLEFDERLTNKNLFNHRETD